jgi:hypothetical protein
VLVLPVVLDLQDVTLPILELLASVLVQTVRGLSGPALRQVFAPTGCSELVGLLVLGSECYQADCEKQKQDSG